MGHRMEHGSAVGGSRRGSEGPQWAYSMDSKVEGYSVYRQRYRTTSDMHRLAVTGAVKRGARNAKQTEATL